MQTPIDAVRLLGDLLEEKEQELSVCSNERDSEALQGLWEVYNSLLEAEGLSKVPGSLSKGLLRRLRGLYREFREIACAALQEYILLFLQSV